MSSYIEGYASKSIEHCPYCGKELVTIGVNGVCKCDECDQSFAVIEVDE